MVIQTNVSQRFRRPENLEIIPNPSYARRTTTINNYRNRNTSQKVKPIPVKRIAVFNAYNNVREVSAEFKIPCVKKTFGKEIVRVCCRTIPQLDNIAAILKELMKVHFIIEIGMPLIYSYKMKTLVLFIKPKNKKISNSIENVFEKCTIHYPCHIVEAKHPSVTVEKVLEELIVNESVQEGEETVATIAQEGEKVATIAQEGETIATIAQEGPNTCILQPVNEERNEMEELSHSELLLFLKIALNIFLLFVIFGINSKTTKSIICKILSYLVLFLIAFLNR